MVTARELRFVLVVDDYEAAARLFRDALGLSVVEEFDHEGARGLLLGVPSATLELLDRDHAAFVDEIEAGRTLDERVRIAIDVDDLAAASEVIADAGAAPLADPATTPWGDRNHRFTTTEGFGLTLFEPPR